MHDAIVLLGASAVTAGETVAFLGAFLSAPKSEEKIHQL